MYLVKSIARDGGTVSIEAFYSFYNAMQALWTLVDLIGEKELDEIVELSQVSAEFAEAAIRQHQLLVQQWENQAALYRDECTCCGKSFACPECDTPNVPPF